MKTFYFIKLFFKCFSGTVSSLQDKIVYLHCKVRTKLFNAKWLFINIGQPYTVYKSNFILAVFPALLEK